MDLRQQVEGYPGHGDGRLRAAEPGPVRHALRRLRGRARAPAEGPRRAAAAARASRRARRSTTWGWPWSGSATRRKRSTPTARPPRFKDATLFNNDGPAVAPLAAAPGRLRERGRPPSRAGAAGLGAAGRRAGRVPARRAASCWWAATTTPTSASTSRSSPAPTPASSGAASAYVVLDLGSTNLTRVNGEVVARAGAARTATSCASRAPAAASSPRAPRTRSREECSDDPDRVVRSAARPRPA